MSQHLQFIIFNAFIAAMMVVIFAAVLVNVILDHRKLQQLKRQANELLKEIDRLKKILNQ